ncbi:MAG: putative NADPH-dependent reductase [Acidimicrobiaceae bacterium]|nr:putative NADPH-dependent reductase [Acidimicrobiaceae bacterium]
MTTVGVLGGTGPAGRGVAIRLASAGYDVMIGSRDETRAEEIATTLLARGEGVIRGASNDVAADCELVVVATPHESAVSTVTALKSRLAGKVVVSMVNALVREGKELIPLYPPRGSMAAQLAFALPDSTIVGAFHHLPASEMENLDSGLEADVVIFSDDAAARETVAAVVDEMPGLRAVIAGSMSLASAVEAFTAVCISVNIRHKAHSYVRLAGLKK